MKTLNESDLVAVWGGVPTLESSFAYDFFYGVGAIAGTIWSFLSQPVPERWHSGMVGGTHI
jgi:hypothetical protein